MFVILESRLASTHMSIDYTLTPEMLFAHFSTELMLCVAQYNNAIFVIVGCSVACPWG